LNAEVQPSEQQEGDRNHRHKPNDALGFGGNLGFVLPNSIRERIKHNDLLTLVKPANFGSSGPIMRLLRRLFKGKIAQMALFGAIFRFTVC
jgi:hypothetical protein